MVAGLVHPLTIFILGLGGGFVIPLVYRLGKHYLPFVFFLTLAGMMAISGFCLWNVLQDGSPIEIMTSGSAPPVSINLRFGAWEGVFALSVNVVALLGAWPLWNRLRGSYAAMLLYLILVMGINGMVMTRDLFNLFVFLEITSIGTYGLLSLEQRPAALSASFKYIMATVLASTFFLLGAALLYYVTGTLNIDDVIVNHLPVTGPIGMIALTLLLACLLIELKPFPANGWGLDVYETAPSGIAALISVGVSAGVFFALFKLLPLFSHQLGLIAFSGGLTFVASNMIGLRQDKVQRLLGYSSIGQMGLMVLALALLRQQGAEDAVPLVVGGLFVNHLLAKAGLFWLAGLVRRENTQDWPSLSERPILLMAFAGLVLAIAGLPPFPGFWAKWRFVMELAEGRHFVWIFAVLLGSLLEAVYLFRWFGQNLYAQRPETGFAFGLSRETPVIGAAVLLLICGLVTADLANIDSLWLFMPLGVGALLYAGDVLSGRTKAVFMLMAVAAGGFWLIQDLEGLRFLFGALLLPGALVIAAGCLYRGDPRPGFHALLAVLLLSLPALLRASTSLEFFFTWEIITLSSYFLIAHGRGAGPHLLPYLLFSLASAFFLLTGFALMHAETGTDRLLALGTAGPEAYAAFALLALGCLIKAGAFGVHVWLPGAYAEADDDFSAILSAVISKVAIFGLLTGTYLAIRSEATLGLAHLLAWIGLVTTVVGAVLALAQADVKRMLAYSSMSQLGYIIAAIALMNHLGWVTALYLVANHLMVKGILFLAIAGVLLRTGTRLIDGNGGLRRRMPYTFAMVLIAVIAMSGLPPLMGFGAKWLLLSAFWAKGWYGVAFLTVIATLLGFLYMARLVHGLFLGPGKWEHASVREAPPSLLIPQFLLAAGILLLSYFPKLVMEPISAAIDPAFAATLVWEGLPLEAIYDYWNPIPIMVLAVTLALVPIIALWLFQGARRRKAGGDGINRFYTVYKPLLNKLTMPFVTQFWDNICRAVLAIGCIRRVYDGNGQTYALYILYYFLILYAGAIG